MKLADGIYIETEFEYQLIEAARAEARPLSGHAEVAAEQLARTMEPDAWKFRDEGVATYDDRWKTIETKQYARRILRAYPALVTPIVAEIDRD